MQFHVLSDRGNRILQVDFAGAKFRPLLEKLHRLLVFDLLDRDLPLEVLDVVD